jgi:hypothetical protein
MKDRAYREFHMSQRPLMIVRTRIVIITEVEAVPSSALQIQTEGVTSSKAYTLSNTALDLKAKSLSEDLL